jgi:hypothetical protein
MNTIMYGLVVHYGTLWTIPSSLHSTPRPTDNDKGSLAAFHHPMFSTCSYVGG